MGHLITVPDSDSLTGVADWSNFLISSGGQVE
jgi:hypothetical protein